MQSVPWPQLRKAARLMGKTLTFRDATVADADFILSIRTDTEKSRFLNSVSGKLEDQQSWLQRYALAEDQAYFIIEYHDAPIGTVRLYDSVEESFCWGSWVLVRDRPSHAAIESALMVYAYAIDHLRFLAAHFDVRKENERVWVFHERFGAQRVGETEFDYVYKINAEAIAASRQRYRKFLDGSVSVSHEFVK